MTSVNRLITIPPSHYCEKARWALEKMGIPYREEGYPPIFHRRPAKKTGGSGSTPVLVTDDGVYPDSTVILQYLQRTDGEGWQPYSGDPELRKQIEDLEEQFDTKLGPHTRRLAYYYLLQHRELFLESVLVGAGSGMRFWFRLMSPLITFLMRKGMKINPKSSARSRNYVRQIFTEVDELLADGREYLVGDEFSAADLTFASLAAPAVLPENYGSPLPALADVPPEMLEVIEEFRAMRAGEFVLRLYRDQR